MEWHLMSELRTLADPQKTFPLKIVHVAVFSDFDLKLQAQFLILCWQVMCCCLVSTTLDFLANDHL